MYKEIKTAIETTIKHGFGDNHCLCHGDLGNIDLLLIANAELDDPEIAKITEKIASQILDDIKKKRSTLWCSIRNRNPRTNDRFSGYWLRILTSL
jgi:lantibiotic modifying enzyme